MGHLENSDIHLDNFGAARPPTSLRGIFFLPILIYSENWGFHSENFFGWPDPAPHLPYSNCPTVCPHLFTVPLIRTSRLSSYSHTVTHSFTLHALSYPYSFILNALRSLERIPDSVLGKCTSHSIYPIPDFSLHIKNERMRI